MKTVRFSFLSVAFSLLVATPALAREITAEEAGKAASAWVARDVSPLGEAMGSSDVAEIRTTLGDDGTPLFHVVRMEGGGTVVTSAESGVRPVIAFFDGDGVPEDPDHPLFAILRADMAKRTVETLDARAAAAAPSSTAESDPGSGTVRFAATAPGDSLFPDEEAEWDALLAGEASEAVVPADGSSSGKYGVSGVSDVRVAKLLKTTWGQSSGAANYYTPPNEAGNADNYVCGCVALAGAQIAKYWGFPTASRPKVTRTCYVSGSSVSKTSMGGEYAWSSMPNSFSGMTTAQMQAVGKLCYDFGVATYMNWASGGSGTGGYCLDDAFRTVFGYANSRTQVQNGGAFSADIIKRAVLANLDAKCPVSLGIDGHQVVADGYGYSSGTLYTHINLGWTGGGDAWYNLPTVDATSMGYTSTVLDEVIYNIFPQKTGDLLTGRVLDKNGNPVSGASVKGVNGSTTVSATTDGHGVYALWVTGGKSWTVTASYGTATGSKAVSVASCVSTSVSGKYYTPGTGTVGNSWGNDITLSTTVPALTLAAALDNTSLSFTTGGDAAWMPQVDETHDGTDAAQSGAIGASQSSWLQTTVTGAGTISFWWNVSSESVNYDYLEFLVDGTQNAKIGGTTGTWAQKTVTVSGTGTHTLRWNYRKDSSDDRGSDCGWVDQVVWTPAATAPSAPSSVSAADGASTANCTVSWGAVSGATSYTVYRHTSNSSGSATAVKSGVTATSYADTAATPGTLYYYWVKAVNSAGTSGFSGSDSGYRKLAAPTISSATGSTSGVALSWSASTGATHYRVFRATSSSGTKTALGSWQTGCTYTDTSGTAGTTYYYFVQAAMNSSGTRPSDYSAYKTGVKTKVTAPSAPTGVTAADGASTANCTVSWGAVSGATSYTVYRHTSNSSGSATTLKTGVTGTSYADTTATPGTLFYYWVKAVNSAGTSGFSGSDSGYRKLSAPTISAATGSTTGVALSWGATTGATHYRVYRATSSTGSKTALGSWQTGCTYTDTSGAAGTTYYYFVQAAMNASGTRPSDYSASKTGAKMALPSAVSTVSASDGTSTASVSLSWSAVSGAATYMVYRSPQGAGSDKAVVVTSGISSTSYADSNVTPGVRYDYWVRAVNSVGIGNFGGMDSGWRKIPNDAFASAVALSGYSGAVEWGTLGATAQSGEPLHADVSNNSAWWTWTAPAKGTVEISTAGSAFDTVLGVYTGTAVGSLTKVAANDDSGGASTSRVVFDTAGAGTVYRIAVAGYDGSAGPLELSWNFEALNAATFTDMSLNASTGVAHVSFKARKGMSYRIQRASSLGGTWTTVKTITPSATGTVAADISLPTSWSSGFVRVVVDE